jgi:hypothetical protein
MAITIKKSIYTVDGIVRKSCFYPFLIISYDRIN